MAYGSANLLAQYEYSLVLLVIQRSYYRAGDIDFAKGALLVLALNFLQL